MTASCVKNYIGVIQKMCYLETMLLILSHLFYCITTHRQGLKTVKPVYCINKSMKVLDKKPNYHHRDFLENCFDGFLFYSDACLMFRLFRILENV